MARAPKQTTAIVDWEAEMAAQADIAAAAQRAASGGGAFFSIKAGQLSFGGEPMPGNMMACVILADTIENSYFDGPYDPNTPASPKCFAFAHDEADLEPHEAVDADPYFERQNATCAGCPQNEWGSAETGKGKACKNVMRLALIPAGTYKAKGGRGGGFDLELWDDPELFASSEVCYLKVPVMSVRNYSTYVKMLASDVRRPPWGVITNVVVVPDTRSQFRVEFEVLDSLSGNLLGVVMPRHTKADAEIMFPYNPPAEAETPKPVNNKLKRGGGRATGAR